jgi:hypothetical protein
VIRARLTVRPFLGAALALWLAAAAPARAAASDPMLAFEARFVPALMSTNVARPDADQSARAAAAVTRLSAEWPTLRARLAEAGRGMPASVGWERALADTGRRIAQADAQVRAGDVQAAHETLEHVRATLVTARRAAGVDHPVDRLVAFHDRMEILAAAAPAAREGRLDAPQRDALTRTYAEARALWAAVERDRPDAARTGMTPERAASGRSTRARSPTRAPPWAACRTRCARATTCPSPLRWRR